ncbi:dephospho-CoA kinase [Reinekea sp.]|uniref:dephospho-CoA kinase n=1 Tax=Reinekea sp. TaxID=1970455 RepID=UPI00398959F5
MIIGLTGGIASGKSTALKLFEALNVPYVDADIVAREVVEPGSTALASIIDRFGDAILLPNGKLDRPALRQAIFSNLEHKQWLEALLHPLIRESMITQLNSFEAPYCLLVAPLLFENGLESYCEKTVTLDIPEELQLERALKRDGSSLDTLKSIIASQWSRQQRLDKADYILDNSRDNAYLATQVTAMHHLLLLQS